MFNDERINAECGKIYSRGILLAVLLTLVYAALRTAVLVIQDSLVSVLTYTEAVILIVGIGILVTGALRFRKDGDERTAFERCSFYKKAGRSFIIAVLGTYILTIPFTSEEMLGGEGYNQLLSLLEIVGCLYAFYAFKTRNINFNYSFIAESTGVYYRRVLKLVGGLWLSLLAPFFIAAVWMLVTRRSWLGAFAILLAYFSSAAGLSVWYFFISLVEKTSYDSMGDGRFALGARIAALACLVVELVTALLMCSYVYYATGDLRVISGGGNIGALIAAIATVRLRLEFILIVLVGLALSRILPQIRKGGLLCAVCRVQLILLALNVIVKTLRPILYRAYSDESIRFIATTVVQWRERLSLLTALVMWTLFIYAAVRELGVSRVLWTIPVLRTVAAAVNIFLTSQNMLFAGTCCTYAAVVFCVAFLIAVLWRYRGFASSDDTGAVEPSSSADILKDPQ